MHVLVTGGTGFVGSNLCRELATRGHDVTALARHPAEPPAEGVEVVTGDVTDPSTLDPAVDGADAVVHLVALSPLKQPRGGEQMHDIVHRAGTENTLQAADVAGVDRFVQLSGIHADPDASTAYLRAKGRAEKAVRSSDLDHVILRPTVAFGPGCEFVPFVKRVAFPYITPLPGGGRTQFQLIGIEDLSGIIADAATEDDHANETYEIGGPERHSLATIAEMVHGAYGRPVTVIPVPMALAGIGMTIGGALPGFPLGRNQYEGLKLDLVTDDNAIEAFGRSPEELERFGTYLDEHIARGESDAGG